MTWQAVSRLGGGGGKIPVTVGFLLIALATGCGDDAAPTAKLVTTDTQGGSGAADSLSADTQGPAPRTCQGNGDCIEPLGTCDPLTKQCTGCLFETDCAPGQHCVAKACVPFTTCKNSLDCTAAKAPDGTAQGICDTATGECVACLAVTDCPPSHSCTAQRCVPYTLCTNSTGCAADEVCDPVSSRCVGCTQDGDCGENQLCEQQTCRSYTPCFSDKQCTPIGLLCDQQAGKCAQCLKDTDCPEVYHCAPTGPGGTGACVLDACQAGQGACDNGALVTCNAKGTGFTSPTACPPQTTCVAADGQAQCQPWLCTPGKACDGEVAVACAEDGLAKTSETDCAAAGQKCKDGACMAAVCTAGTLSCAGNVVQGCSDDGLELVTVKTCAANEYCSGGACKLQSCKPGQPVCEGNTVKTCNADGSGATADPGQDCGKAVCSGGVCKAAVCEANKTYCDGQALKVCNADGLAGVLVKTCGPAEICEGGACKTKACPASQPVCDGNTAKVCNATGTGYTGPGQDCGSQKCSGGVCKAVVCKAASQYCEGGQLKTCSPDGTTVTAQSACPLGTYCGLGKSGDAGCQQMVCNPGQPSCDGTKAAMCNTEGSGFTGAATDCAASGKVCSAGVCTALKCDPQNVLYCEGGAAKKCENGGMTVTTLQTCTATQYCDKGVCQAQVCTPNAAGCNGQTAATCNAQGSGWLPGGVDCAASGKACQAGSCVVTQVCGDGAVNALGEQCDDGNLVSGDGCSSKCLLEDAYSVAVMADGPARRYRLSEKSGTIALDSSGNLLHGTYDGPVQLGGQGLMDQPLDGAAVFSGAGTRVTTPKLTLPAKYSVEAWFKLSGPADDNAYYAIASQPKPGFQNFQAGFSLQVWHGTTIDFFTGGGAGYGVEFIEGGKLYPHLPGNWYHAVATVDTETKSSSLFVQGKLFATLPLTGVQQQPGTPFFIGYYENQVKPMHFIGTIDEVTLYPSVLTPQQVAGHYAIGSRQRSCKAVLQAFPSAQDGIYPIDPDGPGPIAPANLFCDMKNGGLTLVANIYDSAGDDAPNSTDYVVSGWQQTASGKWDAKASTVDRAWGGNTGSAAVSLEFVKALGASAGQKNLKMCFVHKDGYDTTCRNSADGSLTLVSYNTGNPKLTVHSADKLTYTFGRLAGLAGSVDGYDPAKFVLAGYTACVPAQSDPGGTFFGFGDPNTCGGKANVGFCDASAPGWLGIWHAFCAGSSYRPWRVVSDEIGSGTPGADTPEIDNPTAAAYGIRLYIGP